MTLSGKVRCVDCWSKPTEKELNLCKSCGKMANHRTKDCPIEPPQTDKKEWTQSSPFHSGRCVSGCPACEFPQTDKTTWEKKFNKYYGLMFECGDYEQLIKDIAELLKEEREEQPRSQEGITEYEVGFVNGKNEALDVYRGKLIKKIKTKKKTITADWRRFNQYPKGLTPNEFAENRENVGFNNALKEFPSHEYNKPCPHCQPDKEYVVVSPKTKKIWENMPKFKRTVTSPQTDKTTWEERFDLEMNGCEVVHVYETKQYEDIKKFIAELLKEEREEVRQETITNLSDVTKKAMILAEKKGKYQALDVYRGKLIKRIEKEREIYSGDKQFGLNRAISIIKEKI